MPSNLVRKILKFGKTTKILSRPFLPNFKEKRNIVVRRGRVSFEHFEVLNLEIYLFFS